MVRPYKIIVPVVVFYIGTLRPIYDTDRGDEMKNSDVMRAVLKYPRFSAFGTQLMNTFYTTLSSKFTHYTPLELRLLQCNMLLVEEENILYWPIIKLHILPTHQQQYSALCHVCYTEILDFSG